MEVVNNTLSYQLQKVIEFMTVMGQEVLTVPTLPTPGLALFRKHLIDSELYDENELFHSMERDNAEKILDGILDVLYVTYGAMAAFGLKLNDDHKEHLPAFEYDATKSQGVLGTYGDYSRYKKVSEYIMDNFVSALSYDNEEKILDELIDMVMLMRKIGEQMNFNIADAFDEVHASNMSKLCSTEEDAKASVQLYATEGNHPPFAYYMELDGKYIIRRTSDGKVLKGCDFFEPDLSKFIVKVQ